MRTITKRADQLQPGDVILARTTKATETTPPTFIYVEPGVVSGVADVGDIRISYADGTQTCHRGDTMFTVLVGAYTAAQVHAARMVPHLRDYRDLCRSDLERAGETSDDWLRDRVHDLDELLEKIDPPQPPTLEEALAALAKAEPLLKVQEGVFADERATPGLGILERARRAGVLK